MYTMHFNLPISEIHKNFSQTYLIYAKAVGIELRALYRPLQRNVSINRLY